MSRETDFRPEFCKQARKLSLLGLTDQQMADFFEIHVTNFHKWKLRYPQFANALRMGKVVADSRVAQALYLAALKGNVTAQLAWLNNRQRSYWKQRWDVEVTGANGGPIETKDVTDIEAARAVAFAMAEAAEVVRRTSKSGNAAAKTKETA